MVDLIKYYTQDFVDNTYMLIDFDIVIKRSFNNYYNLYKILNNKIVFYSNSPIHKGDAVRIINIEKIDTDIIVHIEKSTVEKTMLNYILTTVSYKVPVSLENDYILKNYKGIEPLFMFIDSSNFNSKLSFLLAYDKRETRNNIFIQSNEYEIKFSLEEF